MADYRLPRPNEPRVSTTSRGRRMKHFALSSLDLAIIRASIALSVTLGFWGSRRVEKTAHGLFLASCRMPWWLIRAAFVSTSASSEHIVGTVSVAYKHLMCL